MAVLHTWRCLAHGEFQSFNPACPSGCDASMVQKVLGCAISVGHSKDTANMVDRKMVDIARQFGVTDLNVRAGRSAAPDEYRWNQDNDIQAKRLRGETYSAPVDHKPNNIGAVIGSVGASSDGNILSTMKDAGSLQMKVNFDAKLTDNRALPT